MKTILHHLRIHAAPNVVFECLTTEEGLGGWWSTHVKIGNGGTLVDFTFVGGFNPDMRIIRNETNRLVEWRCEAGHDPWLDNTFSFELTPTDDGETDLMFTQHYATELSDEVYGNYNFNWGFYLNSLKSLSETGQGTPFDPDIGRPREA
jgi:uncharacterized protein YndB with AHSA1/START domain